MPREKRRTPPQLPPGAGRAYARSSTARGTALGLGVAGLIVAACAHPAPPARSVSSAPASTASAAAVLEGLHFDLGAIDPHADPCVDFYSYACGGWRATHPIPPDRARWSRYSELEEVNAERERAIIQGVVNAGPGASAAEKRVGAMYGACMDEAAVASRGVAPLAPILAHIDAARTAAAVMDVVAELQAHGVAALLGMYVAPDPREVRRMAFTLDRGALGMGDRASYLDADARAVEKRGKYREHLVRLLRALAPDGDATGDADRVLSLETALAGRALTPVEERDAEAQYHPMTPAELRDRYPALDLPGLFAKLGAPPVEHAIVAVPPWFETLNAAVGAGDSSGARAYLRALVGKRTAAVLLHTVEDEQFDFDGRVVSGAKEMAPRWKRCVSLVDATIGDDVGRVFVARYFPPEARARMDTMVRRLRAAYEAKLRTNDWLGAGAKAAAIAKLSKMLIVTGASNRLRDLDGLALDRADLFGDVWQARAFEERRQLGLLAGPTDREEFFDTLPQELDGFSAHEMVAVGFTAGFLQPPVFDPRMDDPVNFGGLGGVIGHELTHEFDDEGRKYDADGNLRSWWSPDDVARFQARAQCFVDEYARFRTEEGTPLNGKLTLGENLADNGGLRLSYEALRPSATGPKTDGYTPAQRFFLAWGQIRCENVTPERERRQALTDGHSAGRWRVNGVVRNMPEFAEAFACAKGAAMAPESRCSMW